MKEEVKYRQDIVHFGKLLHERGYVAATDGNLSVRLDCQSILITPTCISNGMMRAQDLVVVDMQGHKLAGQYVTHCKKVPLHGAIGFVAPQEMLAGRQPQISQHATANSTPHA